MTHEFFEKRPRIRDILISDDFIFDESDINAKISLNESVNVGEDLAFGSCVISEIKFSLANHNDLIDAVAGAEFLWKQEALTADHTYKNFAKKARAQVVCFNGARAYCIHRAAPYLTVRSAESGTLISTPEQPTRPPWSLAVDGNTLYCLFPLEPYVEAYSISGDSLTPVAAPKLSNFFIGKVKEYSRGKKTINRQGNTIKEYKVETFDMQPTNVKEYVYEAVSMGYFTIDRPTKVNETKIDVVGYDRMKRFADTNVDDWLAAVKWPATVSSLLTGLCAAVGVKWQPVAFTNSTFKVQKNISGTGLSGDVPLRWIAQIAASFGKIDRQGNFVLSRYRDVDCTVSEYGFSSLEYVDYVTAPIDKLQIRTTDKDVGVIVGTGKNTYVIENNSFLYAETDAELRAAANAIYAVVEGITYQPCELILAVNPLLSAGDAITIVPQKGEQFKVLIMNRESDGGIDTYTATGNQYRDTQTDMVNQQIVQLRGKVNEVSVTLDGTINRLYDASTGDITQLKLTTQGIEAEVGNQAGEISKLQQTAQGLTISISGVAKDVDGLETSLGSTNSQVSQLGTSLGNTNNQVSQLGTSLGNTQKTVTTLELTTSGLKLAVDNKKLTFNNEGLSVYDGGFRIFNGSTEVFSVASDGSGIKMTGAVVTRGIQETTKKAIETRLTGGGLEFYEAGALTGKITAYSGSYTAFGNFNIEHAGRIEVERLFVESIHGYNPKTGNTITDVESIWVKNLHADTVDTYTLHATNVTLPSDFVTVLTGATLIGGPSIGYTLSTQTQSIRYLRG